jgi:hypothetical protein
MDRIDEVEKVPSGELIEEPPMFRLIAVGTNLDV